MSSQCVLALSCALLAFSAGAAAAKEKEFKLKLESREYKLMLDPKKFANADRVKKANELWDKVTTLVDDKKNTKGSFEEKKERNIVFRDTVGCVLKSQNYSFRDRQDLKDGKPKKDGRELTLKLRTPDMFIAAAAHTRIGDEVKHQDITLEEDIAPVLRPLNGEAGFASPPSMRSLFSVSNTFEEVALDDEFKTLRDIIKRYPDLKNRLEQVKSSDLDADLLPGKEFHEFVLKGPKVAFDEVNAKFDLTLWYPKNKSTGEPVTAELSYKYDLDQGKVEAGTAERAFRLFSALQQGLSGWTSPGHETKTSLALPQPCQDP